MTGEVKVDYTILDGCINNLKTITEGVGGDDIRELIGGLDNVFDNTNSDTAKALKDRKTEYNRVNNMLISLCLNAISLLEVAKLAYAHTDMSLTKQLEVGIDMANGGLGKN